MTLSAVLSEEPKAEKPPRDAHGSLLCSYCWFPATLRKTSEDYYSKDYGPIWACDACAAWVGCHKGSGKPYRTLGRLANKELRQAKMAAHAAFDPLWMKKSEKYGFRKGHARAKGYAWLAEQLGISTDVCHIGFFNVAMCNRVIKVCTPPFGERRNIPEKLKDCTVLSEGLPS